MAPLNYAQTPSGGGEGFRYETKMQALMALRLCNHSEEFNLASNFEKGGKFDDVVFSAKAGGEWSTWFVQLKHRQASTITKKISVSALRSKDQDFDLRKYFLSYKEISKKFSPTSDDPIFGTNLARANFAIFTNGALHDEILDRGHDKLSAGFLSTNASDEHNIRFDLEKDKDIFEKMMKDWYLGAFANKLIFCSRQASQDDLDSLIQNEIKITKPGLSTSELKLVAYDWTLFIERWQSSGRYLVKDHAMSKLCRLCAEAQCGKKEVSVKFVESFLKFTWDQMGQEELVLFVSHADSSIMCMTALKQMGLLDDPNILSSLQSLSKVGDQNVLIRKWMTPKQFALVVDCEGDTLAIDKQKVIDFIKHLKGINKNKKIILVATKENATAAEISKEVNAKQRKFNCSLKNLDDDSKKMLKDQEVNFQGHKTSLASLMPNNKVLEDVFDMASMTQLLLGRLVTVGIKPVEHIPYYVTRVLTRQSAVLDSFFTDPAFQGCVALSGISLQQAKQLLNSVVSSTNIFANPEHRVTEKVIVLEGDPLTEFEALTKKVSVPFHWFEKSSKGLRLWHWKRSTKNIEDVAKKIERLRDFVETNNIMVIDDKVVVITAEPGMGKSTLLEHLAAVTKEQRPHVWVIGLALNEYTKLLHKPDFIQNVELHTKNLIAAAAGVDEGTSKFDARLFNQCYDGNGKMIVLLDGFDEITPLYTKQGLALLRALQHSAVTRVWVTARPVVHDMLQHATSTLPFTIKPFVMKDQKTFLRKYWKHELPMIEPEMLDDFIDRVLDLIKNSFDNKLHQFTGIPLQTRMIAEVFQENLRQYHETGDLVLKKRLNGVQLFEEFVRIKRNVQLEKSKAVVNAISRFDQMQLDDARERDLMSLALLTLLPLDACAQLRPSLSEEDASLLKEKVAEGHEKTGIVLSYKNESPQFIHRTFAEYFVALFFTKHFMANRKFLSSDEFFSKPLEFVRYFFDRILAAGCTLHEAVLDRQEITGNVDALDAGGRTALHIAAAFPDSEDVIKELLEKGAQADVKDKVLGWTPMQYAVKVGSVGNIAPLLEHCPETLEKDSVPMTWENLRLAVSGDYLQLFLHLLENGIFAAESLDELSTQKWYTESDEEGWTILHLAAAYDAQNILKYLLRKDTRDSKLKMIEVENKEGMTPLLQAAVCGQMESALILLSAGANSLVETKAKKNVSQFAIEAQSQEVLCLALADAKKRGAEPAKFLAGGLTSLVGDSTDWAVSILGLLLKLFPELLHSKTTKETSLFVAATIKGNEKIISTLCEWDVDVNEETPHGRPLHLAVQGGHKAVVRELLDCQAIQINAPDIDGYTPLHRATMKDDWDVFKMLVDAGANIWCQANDASDLTHAVAVSQNTESEHKIFDYLLKEGLDFKKENAKNETGLSLLKAAGAVSLVLALDPTFKSTQEPENSTETAVKKVKKAKNAKPARKKPNNEQANPQKVYATQNKAHGTDALIEMMETLTSHLKENEKAEIFSQAKDLIGKLSKVKLSDDGSNTSPPPEAGYSREWRSYEPTGAERSGSCSPPPPPALMEQNPFGAPSSISPLGEEPFGNRNAAGRYEQPRHTSSERGRFGNRGNNRGNPNFGTRPGLLPTHKNQYSEHEQRHGPSGSKSPSPVHPSVGYEQPRHTSSERGRFGNQGRNPNFGKRPGVFPTQKNQSPKYEHHHGPSGSKPWMNGDGASRGGLKPQRGRGAFAGRGNRGGRPTADGKPFPQKSNYRPNERQNARPFEHRNGTQEEPQQSHKERPDRQNFQKDRNFDSRLKDRKAKPQPQNLRQKPDQNGPRRKGQDKNGDDACVIQ